MMSLLVYFLLLQRAFTMFSKRPNPNREGRAPKERLKQNLEDLFLGGDVSGIRAHSLFEDASHIEPRQFKKLAKSGAGGKNHIARNLRRIMSNKSKWPKPYIATLRVWSPKLQRETLASVPMLLPHELMHALLKANDLQDLSCTDRLANSVKVHLQKCRDTMQDQTVVALGLWGDGVPCNWDRSQSVEACIFFALTWLELFSCQHLCNFRWSTSPCQG